MRQQSVALNNPIPHRCFVGHHLGQIDPAALLERLDNTELDEYSDIATLIGIEFDDNTDWGQLTVLELELLIQLALKQIEALCPPKPNVLLTAALICFAIGTFGT